jgi:hypothetical protein
VDENEDVMGWLTNLARRAYLLSAYMADWILFYK